MGYPFIRKLQQNVILQNCFIVQCYLNVGNKNKTALYLKKKKIAGRNINNLRYADDTTLMADNEEELKSRLMKVKEESEKAGLKLNT